MKLSESIKPISYLKAHASEIINDIAVNHKSFVITQNGEAKAIVQDIVSYEQTQETLSLLKMLSQSKMSLDKNKYKPLKQAFEDLRKKIKNQ